MSKSDVPSVGIGLPVYNNSKYLSKTLDSLLSQTYPNIIIYLSDDCSDDGTDDICQLYAKRDNRIKYSRNEKNIGANANNKKVLAVASTDYFMFARGHEILSPNHIGDCVRILEEDETVVLAFATTKWIDDDGNIIPNKPIGYFDTRGFDVVTRCALIFWGNHNCYYGLSRTNVMKSIRGNEDIIGGDMLSLFEKAILGSFAHVCSSVRYRRYNYSGETYQKRIQRYKTGTYKQLKAIDHIFPLARLPYHIFLSAIRSKVLLADKIKILFVVLFNAPLRYIVSRGKQL
ncbi:MAG: glycosyltransferase family 2 protein [Deltaproteobacteria bacterium]|nr:glycosyltransferase family 2 protein [Deltaproteobacteria bacterium]